MNRRSFIQVGLFTSLSPALLQAIERKNEEKACVFIFLGGGISAVDFINPIPDAPIEYRSVNGISKTKTGYDIGGDFPNLAKISNLYTTVRSLRHRDGNHATATHWITTSHNGFGIPEGGEQKEPSYGAFIANKFGENTEIGVPTYIKTSNIEHTKAAWLGVKNAGFDYNEGAIKNLTLTIPENRFKSRLEIMNIIDGPKKNQYGMGKSWGELKETATKVIVGTAGKALDIKNADEKDRLLYEVDRSSFGRNLLIARRSLEAGAKFLTVSIGGWDNHDNIKENFARQAIELDKFLSAFLTDLFDRGLLSRTMVVVCSEFSRTKLNSSAGKDHNPNANSLILAGGKYGDNLIGATDKTGLIAEEKVYSPEDLGYTILNHFGIDKDYTLIDNMRRPRHVINNEAKIIS